VTQHHQPAERSDDPPIAVPRSTLEVGFERALWSARLIPLVAVVVCLLLAVAATVLATLDALRLVALLIEYAVDRSDPVRTEAVTMIVKALDGYLMAALLVVVALGLYELFIGRIDPAVGTVAGGRLLQVHDLEDLKQRVGKLIVLVLLGELLQQSLALAVDDHTDLVALAGAITLAAAALYLTGRGAEGGQPPPRPTTEERPPL
jgi:uncharacterized membrane protein YqhA